VVFGPRKENHDGRTFNAALKAGRPEIYAWEPADIKIHTWDGARNAMYIARHFITYC
jgi:hypothetical protein